MTELKKDVPKIETLKGYFNKTLISVRLSTDLVELIDENYELITGSSEAVTDRKLFECIVDLALSKVKPNIEAKKQIEELQDKIQTLTQENNNLGNSINAMKVAHEQEIEELNNQLSSVSCSDKSELDRLQSIISIQKQNIADLNAELINIRSLPPADHATLIFNTNEKKVIDQICIDESARTGQNVTPQLLLKTVFFFILINGPHDVFKSNITISKIKEILSSPDKQADAN